MRARWLGLAGLAFLLLGWARIVDAVELTAESAPSLIDHMHAVADDAEAPPDDDAPWQTSRLPDRWSQSRPGFAGTVWYRVIVRFEQTPHAPWSVMLPKLSMNADLWVNGMLVGRIGSMGDRLTRHWNKPLLFPVPEAVWVQGDNRVHIRVKALAGQDGGLGRIWIGPADKVAEIYDARALWQIKLAVIADVSIFALGVFFLFIWVRERQEVHYGYFSFGTFFWGVANTNMVLTDPPLPDLAWEWLVHVTLIWGLLLVGFFGFRFGGVRLPRLEKAGLVFAVIAAVTLVLVSERWRVQADAALLLPVIGIGAGGMIVAIKKVKRGHLHDYLLFGIASLATLSMGAHDWFLKAGFLTYDHAYALPFLAPVLLGSMAWLLAGDFVRAQRNLARLNQDLERQVEEREKQLRDSYQRLGESERERAVVAERARILRDMHDGVGSYLSAAIRQIEAGSSTSDDVAQSLRDSLDQLKLSVDSITMPPGDVNGLLASVRYRLQPRMHAAGLSLEWEVDELPHWQSDNDNAMHHLQFMLFEALSNVLQHARARSLRLSAKHDAAAGILIALRDDGQGFQVAPERALRSLRERAKLIGAELAINTGPTGSCVRILLPLKG